MRKKAAAVYLAAVTAVFMGVPRAVPAAETELLYKGSLSAAWFTAPEGSENFGGSDALTAVIGAWKEAHPDIALEENMFAEEEYDRQIEALAGENSLPDVFLLKGADTEEWAEKGLILDLTDNIKKSPYNADYDGNYFTMFRAGGKVYGYPALAGSTGTVVIYDKALWAEAGFDAFPGTWKEVLTAADYFNAQALDTIAFGNADTWQANRSFFSTLANRYTGPDWFQSLVGNGSASFTDGEFIKALSEMQYLFGETKIFNDDFNMVTNEKARDFYITGNAAAYIGTAGDEAYIREALLEADPEKAENMGFASLPQPVNASKAPASQNMVLGYAVAVNPAAAADPDKLAAAVDFAQEVTGPAFTSYAAEHYALSGLTDPENVDLSAFDQVTQDFFKWSYVDTEKCQTYDTYMDGAVWKKLNAYLQALMDGEITPEEAADSLRAACAAEVTASVQ